MNTSNHPTIAPTTTASPGDPKREREREGGWGGREGGREEEGGERGREGEGREKGESEGGRKGWRESTQTREGEKKGERVHKHGKWELRRLFRRMREILAYMCSVRAVNQSCIKWKVSQFQKWLVDNSVSYHKEYFMFCVNNMT